MLAEDLFLNRTWNCWWTVKTSVVYYSWSSRLSPLWTVQECTCTQHMIARESMTIRGEEQKLKSTLRAGQLHYRISLWTPLPRKNYMSTPYMTVLEHYCLPITMPKLENYSYTGLLVQRMTRRFTLKSSCLDRLTIWLAASQPGSSF